MNILWNMRILYGANDTFADVTPVVVGLPSIYIPDGDFAREAMFGCDPVLGVLKHIVVEDDFGNNVIVEAENSCRVIKGKDGKYRVDTNNPETVLAGIHARLQLLYGSFRDEYPEQLMATRYILPHARVLEIGGNIGRNSCVIASLLEDSKQLVVLESHKTIAEQLRENRDLNSLSFHIIPAALSKRRLVQCNWDTKPIMDDERIPQGWEEIDTMSWDDLQHKCKELGGDGIFDTLVADCEGALYYIFNDEPDFLSNFQTVVMENDYHVLDHKESVDEHLRKQGFKTVFQMRGGWGPCADRFFEVWHRIQTS
jgi:FkbM family methyltransferase